MLDQWAGQSAGSASVVQAAPEAQGRRRQEAAQIEGRAGSSTSAAVQGMSSGRGGRGGRQLGPCKAGWAGSVARWQGRHPSVSIRSWTIKK